MAGTLQDVPDIRERNGRDRPLARVLAVLAALLLLAAVASLGVSLAGLAREKVALDWHVCDLIKPRRAELWRPAFRALPTDCAVGAPGSTTRAAFDLLLNTATGTSVLFVLALGVGCAALLAAGSRGE